MQRDHDFWRDEGPPMAQPWEGQRPAPMPNPWQDRRPLLPNPWQDQRHPMPNPWQDPSLHMASPWQQGPRPPMADQWPQQPFHDNRPCPLPQQYPQVNNFWQNNRPLSPPNFQHYQQQQAPFGHNGWFPPSPSYSDSTSLNSDSDNNMQYSDYCPAPYYHPKNRSANYRRKILPTKFKKTPMAAKKPYSKNQALVNVTVTPNVPVKPNPPVTPIIPPPIPKVEEEQTSNDKNNFLSFYPTKLISEETLKSLMPADFSNNCISAFHYDKRKHIKKDHPDALKIQKQAFGNNHIIRSIQKLENPYTWLMFQLKSYENRNSSMEVRLFHGTARKNIRTIIADNFDYRLAGTSRGCRYGRGVNFSNSAVLSMEFTKNDNCMIVAKVLDGKAHVGDHNTILPKDGFVSTGNDGNIVVKYHDHEFYPEYLVFYTSV